MSRPDQISPTFVQEAATLHPEIVEELLAGSGFGSLDMLSVYSQDVKPRGVVISDQSGRDAEDAFIPLL